MVGCYKTTCAAAGLSCRELATQPLGPLVTIAGRNALQEAKLGSPSPASLQECLGSLSNASVVRPAGLRLVSMLVAIRHAATWSTCAWQLCMLPWRRMCSGRRDGVGLWCGT